MKKAALGVAALLMPAALLPAACARVPVYSPVEVAMPVPVPCRVAVPRLPQAWPTDSLPKDAPLPDKIRAVLVELDLRKAYEAEAEAALKVCE